MAEIKRVLELSVEEKKFLDRFIGMLYDEFDDGLSMIIGDIYNMYLNENDPLPQTYKGDCIEIRVVKGE